MALISSKLRCKCVMAVSCSDVHGGGNSPYNKGGFVSQIIVVPRPIPTVLMTNSIRHRSRVLVYG